MTEIQSTTSLDEKDERAISNDVKTSHLAKRLASSQKTLSRVVQTMAVAVFVRSRPRPYRFGAHLGRRVWLTDCPFDSSTFRRERHDLRRHDFRASDCPASGAGRRLPGAEYTLRLGSELLRLLLMQAAAGHHLAPALPQRAGPSSSTARPTFRGYEAGQPVL